MHAMLITRLAVLISSPPNNGQCDGKHGNNYRQKIKRDHRGTPVMRSAASASMASPRMPSRMSIMPLPSWAYRYYGGSSS